MKILFFILAAFLSCSWANAQENAVLFEDDFDDIEGTGGNDKEGWQIKELKVPSVTGRNGWSLQGNVHEANNCVRIGNGTSTKGNMYVEVLNYIGDALLTFRAAPAVYSNKFPNDFSLSLTNGTFTNRENKCTPSLVRDSWTQHSYKINVKSDNKILFTNNGSSYFLFFLDDVKITKCYRRTGLAEDKFGTICMPFAVKHEDLTGATMYNIAYKMTDGSGNVTGIILSEETGDLVAGKPYIFKATATELFAIYNGVSVPDSVPATGLVGNLSVENRNVPEGSFVLSKNQLRKVTTGTATVGQNRAYINLEFVPEYTSPASLSKEYIYFDLSEGEMDFEDGISAPNAKTASASAFDLMGRKVAASGTKKGLIIKGGRKLMNVK